MSALSSVRRRFNKSPRGNVYLGVVMLVVGAFGFYLALTKRLPFTSPGGRLVTAYFSEPNQVQPGQTPVRVDGIQVGKVDTVTAADGGHYGKVVMRITDSGLTLHSDASAQLQFRTMLGANFVVNLNPGSSSAPTLNGAIGLKHTTVQTELDDVLRVFNNSTIAGTRTDLSQLSQSMAGTQAGNLVQVTAPSLKQTPAAFNALRGEDTNDLSRLVSTSSKTMSTLAADRNDLASLVSGGAATLGAVNSERGALASALNKAPGALDSTVAVSKSVEQTLPSLNTLLTALGPGAKELNTAAAATKPTVIKLRTTLDRIQPLLSELKPAVQQLSAAATPGNAVLTGLTPTLDRLNTQILPWLNSNDSDLKRPVYQLIGPTFSALDSVASEYDSQTHVIHFPIQPELNSVTLVPCTVFAAAPTPSELVKCADLNSVLKELLGFSPTSSAASSSSTAERTAQKR